MYRVAIKNVFRAILDNFKNWSNFSKMGINNFLKKINIKNLDCKGIYFKDIGNIFQKYLQVYLKCGLRF
jgi:hypothetical protein